MSLMLHHVRMWWWWKMCGTTNLTRTVNLLTNLKFRRKTCKGRDKRSVNPADPSKWMFPGSLNWGAITRWDGCHRARLKMFGSNTNWGSAILPKNPPALRCFGGPLDLKSCSDSGDLERATFFKLAYWNIRSLKGIVNMKFVSTGASNSHSLCDRPMLVFPAAQVWHQEMPFLRFRSQGNHAECSVCVKMKLWIRMLGDHLHAKNMQLAAYHRHLSHQYEDRLIYWGSRGISRTHGPSIVCIMDGMDQAKFMYPRNSCLKSALEKH